MGIQLRFLFQRIIDNMKTILGFLALATLASAQTSMRQACPPEKPLDCGDFFGVLKGICGASEAECRKFLFTMGRKEAEQPTMRQGCPPEKPLFCGIEPVTVMGVTVSGPWICGVDEADCLEKESVVLMKLSVNFWIISRKYVAKEV